MVKTIWTVEMKVEEAKSIRLSAKAVIGIYQVALSNCLAGRLGFRDDGWVGML